MHKVCLYLISIVDEKNNKYENGIFIWVFFSRDGKLPVSVISNDPLACKELDYTIYCVTL